MKGIWVFILSAISISCANKHQEKINSSFIDLSEDIVIPKHYVVTKTNESLKIDGVPDETAWTNAEFTDTFIDIEGVKIPKYDTKVKLLWDESYLYVYAKMDEPHVWGDIEKRDAIIYLNNDFEVFLDPSQTGYGYGEIEINALNTVWDLFLDKPYRSGGKANFQWDLKDLKTSVHIEGSLNNHTDVDQFWAVEMAIPLKPFVSLKNRPKTFPKEGEQWKLNFSRVQWDFDVIDGKYQRKKENSKFLKEYNWVWSDQKVINMHEPEKWGVLQFTEELNAKNVSYIEDKDLLIKQTAYALFRNTKFKSLKSHLSDSVGTIKSFKVKYTHSDTLNASFFKTNFGFEYLVESNLTDRVYLINEQGILKNL